MCDLGLLAEEVALPAMRMVWAVLRSVRGDCESRITSKEQAKESEGSMGTHTESDGSMLIDLC